MGSTTPHRPIPAILSKLVESSIQRVARLRADSSLDELTKQGAEYERRSLRSALEFGTPAIIAEVKHASPSKGVFRPDLNPVAQAASYQRGGCAAISVVTEPEYFLGDADWITQIRETVTVPVLRKDFIIDPIQMAESAAVGADAILLIARILAPGQLAELFACASSLNLEVLFEAHDEADLDMIRPLNPALIGVNARDLDNFTVDTDRVARLSSLAPESALLVAESGVEKRSDIQRLERAGYGAFLVGEALLRSPDPESLLRSMRGED